MLINILTKNLLPAVRVTLILAVFTGLLFPLLVDMLAHLFFPNQAEGSLLRNKEGIIIGSHLIGQNFSSPRYFHPRPSAAGSGYDATASGGTNLGPTSKKLIDGIKQLTENYRTENNLLPEEEVPVDAVTRSASGLDAHISIQNAKLQAARIANKRHITLQTMLQLIKTRTVHRQFGFLGEPCINVLELNLALDGLSK
jgi:potassium-transporting ATPase KdpC subunit